MKDKMITKNNVTLHVLTLTRQIAGLCAEYLDVRFTIDRKRSVKLKLYKLIKERTYIMRTQGIVYDDSCELADLGIDYRHDPDWEAI